MSIWLYHDNVADEEAVRSAVSRERCAFCNELLRVLKHSSETNQVHDGEHNEIALHVRTCDTCGWWWATRASYRLMTNVGKYSVIDPSEHIDNSIWAATAVLKKLDPVDISAPISEVRDYLTGKFESRFQFHPRLFEQTVASVFGDLGYRATATAYSGDDGIDVLLVGRDDQTIGVQVKRYKDRIGVGQIREFAGSLYLKGMLSGIFVTTSDFQSGAQTTTARYEKFRGMRIKLLNAQAFYEQLQLAQRNRYRSLEDADAPYLSANFILLKREQYRREPAERTPF